MYACMYVPELIESIVLCSRTELLNIDVRMGRSGGAAIH